MGGIALFLIIIFAFVFIFPIYLQTLSSLYYYKMIRDPLANWYSTLSVPSADEVGDKVILSVSDSATTIFKTAADTKVFLSAGLYHCCCYSTLYTLLHYFFFWVEGTHRVSIPHKQLDLLSLIDLICAPVSMYLSRITLQSLRISITILPVDL